MRALHIKLVRDLTRLWSQSLAIALVMAAGVATFILGVGAYHALSSTRTQYYQTSRFADIFVNVTRAPNEIARDIANTVGVEAADPRIVKIALTDIEGMEEPAAVELVSIAKNNDHSLNQIYLRSGRLPDPESTDEAVASEAFAKMHGLQRGGAIKVLINGRLRPIKITGTALSPEFIYALGPGDIMPDDRRFGVLWMPERSLAATYDLEGAFSNLVVRLMPGVAVEPFIEEVDRKLERYGGSGAYGRKDQTSHAFLDAELRHLQAMSRVLPPIFLLVSSFLVNMTLSRLVTLEREQVALLKAIGYSSWAIARHYISFVSLIAAMGIFIGVISGVWLGSELAKIYARYFSFPFLVFSSDPMIYVLAALTTAASAALGAIKAVSDVSWLPPAVAMSPPVPLQYRKMFKGALDLGRFVQQSTVIVARHLLRWPWRTAGGVLGMALACSILVGSLWTFGSVDYMIDATFYRAERQDASISFTDARPISALFAIARLPGVLRAEPYRVAPVKIRNGAAERRLVITGKPQDTDLSRILDDKMNVVTLPGKGLVVSSALADILRLKIGDMASVEFTEGERKTFQIPVTGIITAYLGLSAFMNLDALNRLLGEDQMISGVNLQIDRLKQAELFKEIKSIPSANFIVLQKVSLKKFKDTLAETINLMITVYVVLACIITFGVVYNFARISLSEQGREMASLRVLGFTRGEVSFLLLSELIVIVLVAQPVGWLIGRVVAFFMTKEFSSELYRIPLVINSSVYAWASLAVMAAAALSGLIVRRRIDRLDMIAVLKTRE